MEGRLSRIKKIVPEANQQFELRLARQLFDRTAQHAGKNKLKVMRPRRQLEPLSGDNR
jgi:hypothetical protein